MSAEISRRSSSHDDSSISDDWSDFSQEDLSMPNEPSPTLKIRQSLDSVIESQKRQGSLTANDELSSQEAKHTFRTEKARLNLDSKFLYPAHKPEAVYHAQAKLMRKVLPQAVVTAEKPEGCSCCGKIRVKDKFPLDYPTEVDEKPRDLKNQHFNNRLPLEAVTFFIFIKAVIVFLMLRFFLIDVYILISSIYGQYCSNLFVSSKQVCTLTFSGYNLKAAANQSALDVADILNFVSLVASVLLFYFFKSHMAQTRRNYSSLPFLKTRRFSLLIDNIPSFLEVKEQQEEGKEKYSFFYEAEIEKVFKATLKEWIDDIISKCHTRSEELTFLDKDLLANVILHDKYKTMEFQDKPHKIQELMANMARWELQAAAEMVVRTSIAAVTLCYDLSEMETISNLRQEYKQKHIKAHQNQEGTEQLSNRQDSKTPSSIKYLNYQQVSLSKRFLSSQSQNPGFKLTHFTGKAIVTLQHTHFREYFLNQYERNSEFFKISGQALEISQASDPEDIYWQNMVVTKAVRNAKTIFSLFVVFLVLAAAFFAIYGISQWNLTIVLTNSFAQSLVNFLISFLHSFLVFLVNQILAWTIDFIVVQLKYNTLSQKQHSQLVMTVIAQTINTVFLNYMIYLVAPQSPLISTGLANKVYYLVGVNGFSNLAKTVIPNIGWFRAFYQEKLGRKNFNNNMFQSDLNALVEAPVFDLINAYAYYIMMTFLVSFYAFICPASSIMMGGIFLLQFWADKFSMFRYYSCPIDHDDNFADRIFSVFQTAILFAAVGHLLWDFEVHFQATLQYKLINIVGAFLCLFYVGFIFLVSRPVRNRILRVHERNDALSFSDYWRFKVNQNCKTYFSQNPATSCFSSPQILFSSLSSDTISSNIPNYILNALSRRAATKKMSQGQGFSLRTNDERLNNLQMKIKEDEKKTLLKLRRIQEAIRRLNSDISEHGQYKKKKEEEFRNFLKQQHNLFKELKDHERTIQFKKNYWKQIRERETQLKTVQRKFTKLVNKKLSQETEKQKVESKLEELQLQNYRLKMMKRYCEDLKREISEHQNANKNTLIRKIKRKEKEDMITFLLEKIKPERHHMVKKEGETIEETDSSKEDNESVKSDQLDNYDEADHFYQYFYQEFE